MDNYKKILKRIIVSFLLIVGVISIGFISGEWINKNHSLSDMEIIWFRVSSFGLIGWGVLSRLGWEIQSYGGKTIPEVLNRVWFYVVYFIGLYLGVVSLFL